jgi:hypothetical protein
VSRRALVLSFAALLVLAALVLVGNWERQRRADQEMSGMRDVIAAVGPLDNSTLKGFRILTNFDCLVYERGTNPFALELCVADDGRVVEAIDRRSGESEIWSLRDDPTRSEVRLDRREVNRLLLKMNVPPHLLPPTS